MRKLIESTLVSLDGVIESPEPWAIFDEEATERSMQELDNSNAFVMGRVTNERFRDNWSSSSGNLYFDCIAAMPKYVASRSLIEVTWNASRLDATLVHATGGVRRRAPSAHRRGRRQLLARPDAHRRRPLRNGSVVLTYVPEHTNR